MAYKVNSKVFETEAEAREFSRHLQALGGLGGWTETTEKPTHKYRPDLGMGYTEPITAGLARSLWEWEQAIANSKDGYIN
jgi:hypothetical protein